MREPIERIETEIADIWIDSERIIHMNFKDSEYHGIDEAKSITKAHNLLADGTPCPVLANIQSVSVGADRYARKHYVSEEGSSMKTAMAMVVKSPVQRMLGNIFVKINRPPYPTRLFSKKQDAVVWLMEVTART